MLLLVLMDFFTFALLNCLFSMPRYFTKTLILREWSFVLLESLLRGGPEVFCGSRDHPGVPGTPMVHLKEVTGVRGSLSHLLEDGGVVGAEELVAFVSCLRRGMRGRQDGGEERGRKY